MNKEQFTREYLINKKYKGLRVVVEVATDGIHAGKEYVSAYDGENLKESILLEGTFNGKEVGHVHMPEEQVEACWDFIEENVHKLDKEKQSDVLFKLVQAL